MRIEWCFLAAEGRKLYLYTTYGRQLVRERKKGNLLETFDVKFLQITSPYNCALLASTM